MTSEVCKESQEAHNGINGRYCDKLKLYVEYKISPPCQKSTSQER